VTEVSAVPAYIPKKAAMNLRVKLLRDESIDAKLEQSELSSNLKTCPKHKPFLEELLRPVGNANQSFLARLVT